MEIKTLDLLDSFDGSEPVAAWVDRANKLLKLARMEDDLTSALAVAKKLGGQALNFYQALSDETKFSWGKLQKELVVRFTNHEQEADILSEVCNLTQGNMIPIDYAVTKINLAGRLTDKIHDEVLIPLIIKGLNPDTRGLIATSDIESLEKLIKILTKLNKSSVSGKPVSAVKTTPRSAWLLPKKGTKLTEEQKAKRREWAYQNRRCLFCLSNNHFMASCPRSTFH